MDKENPDKNSEEEIRFRELPLEGPPSKESEPPAEEAKPPEGPSEELRLTELSDVADQVKSEPTPLELEEISDKEEFVPIEEETIDLYKDIYKGTSVIYEAAAEGGPLDIAPLGSLAEALVASMVRHDTDIGDEEITRNSLYLAVMVTASGPMDWAAHAINVATLAVRLGSGRNYDHKELSKLALAGLLHGVGMMGIPSSILEQSGPLSSKQRSVIESHPLRGEELLSGLGSNFEWLKTVIAQEHERHQGQGYPRGLSGKDIHEFASLIGLVDSFAAMTHPRSWRPAITPHKAAKEIVFTRKNEFDPRLIKLFLQKLSIFPINSLVKLSNNLVGRVLIVHEDSPLRPTIEILHDPHEGHAAEHKVFDLRKRPLIYIVGAISERALGQLVK